MKCPKCKSGMTLIKKDDSVDLRIDPEKTYSRRIYWCKKDDVWARIEAPATKKKS